MVTAPRAFVSGTVEDEGSGVAPAAARREPHVHHLLSVCAGTMTRSGEPSHLAWRSATLWVGAFPQVTAPSGEVTRNTVACTYMF